MPVTRRNGFAQKTCFSLCLSKHLPGPAAAVISPTVTEQCTVLHCSATLGKMRLITY